jgi:tetratricopeptide (TPR) repeat protein
VDGHGKERSDARHVRGIVARQFRFNWWVSLLLGVSLAVGCSPRSHLLEPEITYCPQERHLEELPSAFSPLKQAELNTAWGKELVIGASLARQLDLYRAVTAYKRGLILIPPGYEARQQQLEYGLFLSYYLGQHYSEAVEVFEGSEQLQAITADFPAIHELLVSLCDSYYRSEQPEQALRVAGLLEELDMRLAQGVRVRELLGEGRPLEAREEVRFHPSAVTVMAFVDDYERQQLSVTKAQWLNALLPGAGYYYVGQTKAAMTSLTINVLFSTAAYQFFKRGEWAAGVIAASLEMGWYLGGINGAGLAAKQYNESIYQTQAKEAMIKGRLFPVLTFETAF